MRPLRLTRRGRLVARAVLILTAALVLLALAVSTRAEEPAAKGPAPVVIVQRGDTLWSIARRHGISVQAIRSTNRLPSRLQPGQVIAIPAR